MTPSLALLGLLAEREKRAAVVPPFPIPAGAESVSSRVVEGAEEWWWTLRRVYPAHELVEQYARHAAGLGWTPCAVSSPWESWFASDLGKTQFMLARIWENSARGEAILLFLRYLDESQDPQAAPGNDKLYVNILLVPASQLLERLPQLS